MKNTTAIGREAEDLAVQFLKKQGYKIIERNYRDRFCEIDIIAKNQGFICFVEVKFRNTLDFGGGLGAINFDKQRRLKKSAEFWLAKNQLYTMLQPRIDVIAVNKQNHLEYIENAIE